MADRFDHDQKNDHGDCQQDINGILALFPLNFLQQARLAHDLRVTFNGFLTNRWR